MLKMKITGVKELQKNLEKLGDEFTRKLEAATRAGALVVQNDAKQRAPYRTGTLRRSIHTEITSRKYNQVEALVGTDVEYAQRIEMGFSGVDSLGRRFNQPPNPYLRPALDENQDAVQKEIANVFRELLRGFKP